MTILKSHLGNLEALHAALAKTVADKIKSGDATAADMAVARQFLKVNWVDAIPTKGSPLGKLAGSLPFPDADGVREENQRYRN